MNKYTWTVCILIEIYELADNGMIHIIDDKVIQKVNCHFRNKEFLPICNTYPRKEPPVFTFPPECRTNIVQFCSKFIQDGSLSTEILLLEIRNVMLPHCYSKVYEDTVECNRNNILNYNDLLIKLRLKSVSYSTVGRWMKY